MIDLDQVNFQIESFKSWKNKDLRFRTEAESG